MTGPRDDDDDEEDERAMFVARHDLDREPESLDAWARRVAPTLTDRDWTDAFAYSNTPVAHLSNRWAAQVRALLAELDRIAGELTQAQLRVLSDLAAGYCKSGKWWSESVQARLRDRGLLKPVHRMAPARKSVTSLGRAVLARKAAQR